MVKKMMKSDDGHYHAKGSKHEMLIGSRAQVMHGTAYKTAGNLTKSQLLYNKHHHIVSRKKHVTAKKERRLEKAGYFTKKGKFGFVKRSPTKSRKYEVKLGKVAQAAGSKSLRMSRT